MTAAAGRRFREWWEPRFFEYERWASGVGLAALVIGSEVVIGPRHLDSYLDANRYVVFGAIAGVCGALLGLVIAASALVLDRLAEGRLDLVKQSRHARTLPAVFTSAMASLGGATIFAIVVLVPTGSGVADRVLVYAWAWFGLLVIARLSRVIWIVGLLMSIVVAQESPT